MPSSRRPPTARLAAAVVIALSFSCLATALRAQPSPAGDDDDEAPAAGPAISPVTVAASAVPAASAPLAIPAAPPGSSAASAAASAPIVVVATPAVPEPDAAASLPAAARPAAHLPAAVPNVPPAAAAPPAGAADSPIPAPRAAHHVPPPAPVPPPPPPPPPTPSANEPPPGAPAGADLVRDARAAALRGDSTRLAALRAQADAANHPLAAWIDYWELRSRLTSVSSPEIEAFYARWPGSYVEDRLRNDWLLELGHRRDWTAFARDFPRFRMNDDRQVTCYALLADLAAGKDVNASAARSAWFAQRDGDEGCQLLAQTMLDAHVFSEDDVWRRLRKAAEFNRPNPAKAAASFLPKATQQAVGAIWDNPARWLAKKADGGTPAQRQLVALALARMAASDPVAAATQFASKWEKPLGRELAPWTWAAIGKQAAISGRPESIEYAERAWSMAPSGAAPAGRKGAGAAKGEPAGTVDWGDDLLGWQARAFLRFGGDARWSGVARALDAMTGQDRADPAWIYWRARARDALARDEAEHAAARADFATIASPLSFYGLLAAEELGPLPPAPPPRPAPPTLAERDFVRSHPGFRRALMLAAIDLRDEARREWNYTLRGLDDRQLIAAAQWACEASDWQICINTSERTKAEFDVRQRYVMPYAGEITSAAQSAGVDPALAFGLIRQETRFMNQIASAVGASGLMQLMPPTAKWVAKKAGVDYTPSQITDPATNLRLGTIYLRMVMDSFGGSVPMAAAAYNAGPARPRRWRDGPPVEPAIWIENIPFNETRDYVKKVSTNYAVYTALLTQRPAPLKPRLGGPIGPPGSSPAVGADLP